MFSSEIETKIKDVCNDKIATDYLKRHKNIKAFYECSKLSIFNTEYKQGQYVLLPESTNEKPLFGKIFKLLCCEQGKYGYLYIEKTTSSYNSNTDLYIVNESGQFDIIAAIQLPDYHSLDVVRVLCECNFS